MTSVTFVISTVLSLYDERLCRVAPRETLTTVVNTLVDLFLDCEDVKLDIAQCLLKGVSVYITLYSSSLRLMSDVSLM